MHTRPGWFVRLVLVCVGVWLEDCWTVAAQARSDTPADAAIEELLSEGRYEDAELSARMVLGSTVLVAGSDGRDALRWQLIRAAVLNGHWGDATVRSLSEQLLEAAEGGASSSEHLSRALHAHAELLLRVGEFETSVRSAERLVALQESPESADADLADAHELLARGLVELRQYDEAALAADRALAIRQSATPSDHAAFARTLGVRVLVGIWKGDYGAARRDLDRALTIRATLPHMHPETADLLALDGLHRYITGDHKRSQTAFSEALRVADSTLRAGHPARATFLRRLAMPIRELGGVAEARSLQERALALVEDELPDRLPVAEQLTDLADTLRIQGEYAGALPHYERALDICERRLGRDHTFTTTAVYNLSILLATLGDMERARPLHARAIAAWTRSLGATHPIIAGANWEFAQILAEQGFTAEAQPLLERAYEIRRQALSADHPALAQAMSALASVTAVLGQLGRATTLSTDALAVWQREGWPVNSGLADSLMVHGRVRVAARDYQAAERAFRQARDIRVAIFGTNHPGIGEADIAIAEALSDQHRDAEAIDAALDGEALGRTHSRLILGYLPERQALQFVATRPRGLNLALTAATGDGDASRIFEAVIRSRALVLDEMAARRQQVSTGDESTAWTDLSAARQRLANLVVRASDAGDGTRLGVLLRSATEDKERAERSLAASGAAFRASSAEVDIGLAELRSLLPPGTALVSFVRYERILAPTTGHADRGVRTPRRTRTSYMAFVFRPDVPGVTPIQLGSADSLERLIGEWRRVVGRLPNSATRNDAAVGAALRSQLWDPISPRLSGVSRVFVVPDGLLNLVPFAALPTNTGRYLLEEGPTIHYMAAERDLRKSTHSGPEVNGLLAIGGPTFGNASSSTAPVRVTPGRLGATQSARDGCATYRDLRFAPLPGTREEVLGISGLWRESGADSPSAVVVTLMGPNATEHATKEQIVGKRVVHFATHGFFLGDDCAPTSIGTRAVGRLISLPGKVPPVRSPRPRGSAELVSPLLRGGLALSGANRRPSAGASEDDGILTAEEVAGMNLNGTEWAVLSACDTGLGSIAAGEGVLGLRRAFQIAGARTVIMSLWSVQDRAAQQWMEALYRARLERHLDTADASREAGLVVLRDRRARGLSTNPFYWAGFVAAGDWR